MAEQEVDLANACQSTRAVHLFEVRSREWTGMMPTSRWNVAIHTVRTAKIGDPA